MAQTPRDLTPDRSAKDLFGAELRHWRELRNLSQTQLALLIHFTADLIAKIERAERWPRDDFAAACDRQLKTGGALTRMWPLVEREHLHSLELAHNKNGHPNLTGKWLVLGRFGTLTRAHTGRDPHTGRAAPQRHPRASGSIALPATTDDPPTDAGWAGRPLTGEEVLVMTAHESAEYHNQLNHTEPPTLDLLRDRLTRLARSFANAPRLEVFGRARSLRDETFTLLTDGRHMAESRELYFMCAAASGMLAEITENFGFRAEAMAHARTGWLCAERSGHNDLMAWILGEQSRIAYWDGRPGQAADYARRGTELATSGTVTVWLPASEARATAALGNTDAARSTLEQIDDLREQATGGELDEIGGILSFGVPRQHSYSSQTYGAVGDHAAVIREAEACIAGYRDGADSERAYDTETMTQVELAIGHVLSGDLDSAHSAAQSAVTIAHELRVDNLNLTFRRLHQELCAPALTGTALAVEMREQVEDFLAAPAHIEPGA